MPTPAVVEPIAGLLPGPPRPSLPPPFWFRSPTHEEALARLAYLVRQRCGMGVLTGEAGTGKSQLLQMCAADLRRAGHPVATVSLLGLQRDEFLSSVAQGWGLHPKRGLAVPLLWRLLSDRLAEYGYQQLHAVLLLDDADQADAEVLRDMARLARCDVSPHAPRTMLLAGQDRRIRRLGEALLDLSELRITLEPWDVAETEAYVHQWLRQGGDAAGRFASAAVACLHQLTGGIPRRVGRLARLSLLAAGDEGRSVTDEIVQSVWQELVSQDVATPDGATP